MEQYEEDAEVTLADRGTHTVLVEYWVEIEDNGDDTNVEILVVTDKTLGQVREYRFDPTATSFGIAEADGEAEVEIVKNPDGSYTVDGEPVANGKAAVALLKEYPVYADASPWGIITAYAVCQTCLERAATRQPVCCVLVGGFRRSGVATGLAGLSSSLWSLAWIGRGLFAYALSRATSRWQAVLGVTLAVLVLKAIWLHWGFAMMQTLLGEDQVATAIGFIVVASLPLWALLAGLAGGADRGRRRGPRHSRALGSPSGLLPEAYATCRRRSRRRSRSCTRGALRTSDRTAHPGGAAIAPSKTSTVRGMRALVIVLGYGAPPRVPRDHGGGRGRGGVLWSRADRDRHLLWRIDAAARRVGRAHRSAGGRRAVARAGRGFRLPGGAVRRGV